MARPGTEAAFPTYISAGIVLSRSPHGGMLMLGRVFMGRYETIRLLGEGGMGRVYLARQLDLGRQVVVKVMHDHIAADPQVPRPLHRAKRC